MDNKTTCRFKVQLCGNAGDRRIVFAELKSSIGWLCTKTGKNIGLSNSRANLSNQKVNLSNIFCCLSKKKVNLSNLFGALSNIFCCLSKKKANLSNIVGKMVLVAMIFFTCKFTSKMVLLPKFQTLVKKDAGKFPGILIN